MTRPFIRHGIVERDPNVVELAGPTKAPITVLALDFEAVFIIIIVATAVSVALILRIVIRIIITRIASARGTLVFHFAFCGR